MKKTIFLFSALLLLTGCRGLETIQVGQIKEVKFRGFYNNQVKIEVYLPVMNPGNMPLKITKMDLTAYYKNKPLGYINTDQKIKIPARSEAVYVIPLSIRITNIFSGISLFRNWSDSKMQDIDIEGEIIAWSLLIRRKVEVDKNFIKSYLQ